MVREKKWKEKTKLNVSFFRLLSQNEMERGKCEHPRTSTL